MDPTKDFQLIAHDFLKIIAYKRANNQTREADTLEIFYDSCLLIVNRASEELHRRHLSAMTEHFKAKILEMEMKQVYNEIFKLHPPLAINMIQRSVIPTKKQLSEEVIVK